ncbi:MAG: DUF433 domain-containing protein [Microscillaceae bacterium]|nr:DUF433 domain-containing protein [Microscillaceae bacterium]
MKNFQYIVSNPAILNGKPCIKGSRISIDLILEWLASGATLRDIQEEYTHLSYEALQEALLYAAYYLKNDIFIDIPKTA